MEVNWITLHCSNCEPSDWIDFEKKEQGLPPRENDPFCGDRYSFQCLVGNENTGQVGLIAHIYDYDKKGWMPFDMSDGPDSDEYETQFVSHWALWPRCKFVCLDNNQE